MELFLSDIPRGCTEIHDQSQNNTGVIFPWLIHCLKKGAGESLDHPSLVLTERLPDPAQIVLGHFLQREVSGCSAKERIICQWKDQPFQQSLLVINVTFKAFLINILLPNKNCILLFYLRLKSYVIYYTSVIYVHASNQSIIWFAVSVSELLCFSVRGRLFILWLPYLISASNISI